ncbi:MAG: hypothetical protein V7L27_15035 [Nostoc sp.]
MSNKYSLLITHLFIPWRAWKPTDKLFPSEVDTYDQCRAPTLA